MKNKDLELKASLEEQVTRSISSLLGGLAFSTLSFASGYMTFQDLQADTELSSQLLSDSLYMNAELLSTLFFGVGAVYAFQNSVAQFKKNYF